MANHIEETGIANAVEQVTESEPVTEIIDVASGLFVQGEAFLNSLWRPWNAYQIGIAIALFLVAYCLRLVLGPRIRTWMGTREGWPKWRMRILAVVHQRLQSIFFVCLLWAGVFILRASTWPSRSYILSIIATLALAWLAVTFTTRLIRSPFLRKIVRWGLLAFFTLQILGITSEASRVLDSASVTIGDFRISLLLILQGVVILGVLVAMARFASNSTSRAIERNEDISPSMQVLIIKGLQVFLYGAAIYIGVKAIGLDLSGLAILSGAIGVGLGFGLQKVVSNLVSGVIILLDKSIKPGDVISLGDTFGWINTLGARYASVVTRDGREYLIPNEDLITNQVVNWSHSNDYVRLDIHFGTAYDDDPHVVRKLAVEAARGVNRVLSLYKEPVCHIVGFGDSSVDYILRFWIKDPTGGLTNIRGQVYLAIWDAFKEHNISIPFPQREVKMLKDDDGS